MEDDSEERRKSSGKNFSGMMSCHEELFIVVKSCSCNLYVKVKFATLPYTLYLSNLYNMLRSAQQ